MKKLLLAAIGLALCVPAFALKAQTAVVDSVPSDAQQISSVQAASGSAVLEIPMTQGTHYFFKFDVPGQPSTVLEWTPTISTIFRWTLLAPETLTAYFEPNSRSFRRR